MAIIGTDSSETIVGSGGNDTIIGRGGNDTLTGNGGNDVFEYDTRAFGSDLITDFSAGDKIDLSFLNVADLGSLTPFMEQVGDDVVITLGYDSSTEVIRLQNVSLASLTAASFVFNSSAAALTVTGTGYRDVLFGGSGNDTISAGAGSDSLVGGAGNDRLVGGSGDDWLMGGAGNDVFAYNTRAFNSDTIADFNVNGDKVDLAFLNVADLDSLRPFMEQVGDDVVITLGYDSTSELIRLQNVSLADLSASDFVFNAAATNLTVTGTGYRDVLFGGNGNDSISGGVGSDSLVGGAGTDRIVGGSGDDWMMGGAGNDVFAYNTRAFNSDTIADFNVNGDRIDLAFLNIGDFGSLQPFMQQVGADVVITLGYDSTSEVIRLQNVSLADLSASDFVFNAAATNLTVTGTGYRDVLFGGNGNDTISGGVGSDSLVGGAGTDRLVGGSGDDWLMGGAGNDVFAYNTRAFNSDTIADFNTNGDRIDLAFLNVGDFGSLQPFMQQVGADVVITLGYDSTSEVIRLQNVSLATLSASDFVFNSSAAALSITGTGYRDTLFGGNGSDSISGGSGDDTLVGGGGNDTLRGGTGGDRFIGGTGSDTVTYSGTTGPVTVNLASGVGSGGEAQGDTYNGIENAIGSSGGDSLVGSVFANTLQGLDGNDVLRGGAGADVLDGGAGSDTASYYYATTGVSIDLGAHTASGGEAQGDVLTGIENLTGGQGNDILAGDTGANTLAGWGGDDVLRGGAGADRLDGGAGTDTASYYSATTGVVVSLASGLGTGGEAQGDVLVAIENITGGQGWDQLYGNAGANVLQGWNGNDLLVGRGGKDTLTGGAGADRFQFTALGDSVVGANADRITDFSRAQGDKIDLAGIDANTAAAGDQGFSFIGSGAFTHHAGELRAAITAPGVTTIAGDINGDGVSDFHIQLTGAFALQASDFVL